MSNDEIVIALSNMNILPYMEIAVKKRRSKLKSLVTKKNFFVE